MSETVVIIRPSFKKICGDEDACRAALFNQMLYNIAWKVKQGVDYWYGTAEDICKAIDCSWCVNKVRKEVAALVELGLLKQHQQKSSNRTYQYSFGKEQGQKLKEVCKKMGICLLHLGLPMDVLHLLKMVNAIPKNGSCNCQKEEMQTPKVVDEVPNLVNVISKDTPKIPTKDTTEETEEETRTHENTAKENPLPSLPPSSSFHFEEKKKGGTPLEEKILVLARTHLAPPGRKETEMERNQALEEMVHRIETLSALVGEEEALRHCEVALLYLKHVDRFWSEHHQFLTLVKAEKFFEEAEGKSRDWTPPGNATRLYPDDIPAPQTDTQEMPNSSISVTQAIGMTLPETEQLDSLICEAYPGIQARYGSFPDGSYCLSLYIDGEAWCDLFSHRDWYHPKADGRALIRRALASYEQDSGVVQTEPVGVAS